MKPDDAIIKTMKYFVETYLFSDDTKFFFREVFISNDNQIKFKLAIYNDDHASMINKIIKYRRFLPYKNYKFIKFDSSLICDLLGVGEIVLTLGKNSYWVVNTESINDLKKAEITRKLVLKLLSNCIKKGVYK